MNTLTTALRKHIEAEAQLRGGFPAYREFVLQHLQLKTVIKESHCTPIHSLVFNHVSEQLGNLFATVGKNQATIYDDNHMGDYVSIVVHFVNTETRHHKGGDFSTCAWVNVEGLSRHPHGDAWLAVSGADPAIQVISVVEARVIALLKGHTCEVVHLSSAAGVPGLLLSLSRDGNIRLWDLRSATCLISTDTDATTAGLQPDGSCFVTGHRNGRMRHWKLPLTFPKQQQHACSAHVGSNLQQGQARLISKGEQQSVAGADVEASLGQLQELAHGGTDATDAQQQQQQQQQLQQQQQQQCNACGWELKLDGQLQGVALRPASPLTDTVDCIRFLPGDRLAAKSCDGCINIWRTGPPQQQYQAAQAATVQQQCSSLPPSMQLLASMRVPGGSSSSRCRCTMSTTRDGEYLTVGSSSGEVLVYGTETGSKVAQLEGMSSGRPPRACALAADCRHLLAVMGNGFIFRFEYVNSDDEPATQAIGAVPMATPTEDLLAMGPAAVGPVPAPADVPAAVHGVPAAAAPTAPPGDVAMEPAAADDVALDNPVELLSESRPPCSK